MPMRLKNDLYKKEQEDFTPLNLYTSEDLKWDAI